MTDHQQVCMSDTPAAVVNSPPPLAKYGRLRSSDMTTVRQHSSTTFGSKMPFIDLERRGASFNFVHNQLDLSRTSLHVLDYNCSDCAVRIEMPPMQPFLLLQFSLAGEAELSQDGRTHLITPGHFKIVHGDSPLSGRLFPGYRSMILLISREALDLALAEQIGRRPDRPLVFDSLFFGENGPGTAVSSLSMTLCANIDSGDPAFMREPVTRRVEDLIISLVLWSLPHSYTPELEQSGTSVPYYVRRVERFISEHARTALSFADLVEVSGVAERTLQDGFRKYRYTTPMAYLKNERLQLARKALLDSADRRVTDVALDCGFTHLSKFATEYRERFGELPSETLRKRGQIDVARPARPGRS